MPLEETQSRGLETSEETLAPTGGTPSSRSGASKLGAGPAERSGQQTPKVKRKGAHGSRASLHDSGDCPKQPEEDGGKKTTPRVSSFKRSAANSALHFAAKRKSAASSSLHSSPSAKQARLDLEPDESEDERKDESSRKISLDEESSSSLLVPDRADTQEDKAATGVKHARGGGAGGGGQHSSRTSRHTSPSPGPFSKAGGSGRTSPAPGQGPDSGNTTPRSRSLSNLLNQQPQAATADQRFEIIEEEKRPNILWCRVCELPVMIDEFAWEEHAQCQYHQRGLELIRQKAHGKRQSDFQGLLETQFVDLNLLGPDDINLKKVREHQLKAKQRQIINNLATKCQTHETAAITITSREIFSENRKRIQKLFRSLDQQITPNSLNYEEIENILKEMVKILAQRKEADLHIFRRMKYIPCLMEIIQKVNVVPKNQIKSLEKLIEGVVRVISLFCSIRQNRLYLINSNRLLPLAKLLLWTLNRYQKEKFNVSYLAPLVHLLTQVIRHKMLEIPLLRNQFLEYLLCSPLLSKIKFRHHSLPEVGLFGNYTTDAMARISGFLESVTQSISQDARYRPVYDKSHHINTEIHYMLYITEVGDILGLLTVALGLDHPEESGIAPKDIQKKLGEEEKKGEEVKKNKSHTLAASSTAASSRSQLIPRRTTSIIAVNCLKTMNNVCRIDLDLAQMIWQSGSSPKLLLQALTHILDTEPNEQAAFDAAEELSCGSQIQMGNPETEEWMEMLHEIIVLIGYLSLLNKDIQDLMGKHKILVTLCNKLPFRYFSEQKYQAILFPTLISLCFEHKRNTLQVDDQLSIEDYLVKYVAVHMELSSKLETPPDAGSGQTFSFMKRSASVSSTASSNVSVPQDMANGISPYLSFSLRFPQKLWNRAVEFFRTVCSQDATQ